jgi:hypothetical protein
VLVPHKKAFGVLVGFFFPLFSLFLAICYIIASSQSQARGAHGNDTVDSSQAGFGNDDFVQVRSCC